MSEINDARKTELIRALKARLESVKASYADTDEDAYQTRGEYRKEKDLIERALEKAEKGRVHESLFILNGFPYGLNTSIFQTGTALFPALPTEDISKEVKERIEEYQANREQGKLEKKEDDRFLDTDFKTESTAETEFGLLVSKATNKNLSSVLKFNCETESIEVFVRTTTNFDTRDEEGELIYDPKHDDVFAGKYKTIEEAIEVSSQHLLKAVEQEKALEQIDKEGVKWNDLDNFVNRKISDEEERMKNEDYPFRSLAKKALELDRFGVENINEWIQGFNAVTNGNAVVFCTENDPQDVVVFDKSLRTSFSHPFRDEKNRLMFALVTKDTIGIEGDIIDETKIKPVGKKEGVALFSLYKSIFSKSRDGSDYLGSRFEIMAEGYAKDPSSRDTQKLLINEFLAAGEASREAAGRSFFKLLKNGNLEIAQLLIDRNCMPQTNPKKFTIEYCDGKVKNWMDKLFATGRLPEILRSDDRYLNIPDPSKIQRIVVKINDSLTPVQIKNEMHPAGPLK